MKHKTLHPLSRAGAVLMTSALLVSTPLTALTSMAAETDSTAVQTIISSGLTMSTDYPGISVKAGDSISFSLDFTNSGSGEMTTLSTSSLPDGFEGYFQGNGHTVSSVYVKNGENDSLLTYTVNIPETASDGEYKITLYAKGASKSASLTLTLNVSELDLGASTMTTDYEEQEGTSGTSFSFSSTINNNSTEDQSYAMSAEAPDGWNVTYTASDGSTSVSAIDVEGASSTNFTIKVAPAAGAEAGDYTIPIKATSASETLNLELKVTITGSYDLALTTQNETLSFDAKANKKTSVVLTLKNDGNIALTDINLSASAPTDWTVEFSESTIDSLDAGASKEVTAYVTPAQSAISGDYVVSMTAKAKESSVSSSFRVTVETQTVWGIVGIIIIAAIFACLYEVFKKFGRH